MPPAEARQTITAQSADFGAYRQRLAVVDARHDAGAEPSRRQGGGKVQASVDDKKQAASADPDKLKLSKGGATPPSAPAAPRIACRASASARPRPRASPS